MSWTYNVFILSQSHYIGTSKGFWDQDASQRSGCWKSDLVFYFDPAAEVPVYFLFAVSLTPNGVDRWGTKIPDKMPNLALDDSNL